MESDPFRTQRDVGPALVSELRAAGFVDADEIGRGGFGIVFRCVQEALDRVVAVKVLTAELDEDRERFLREQRAMGRLTGHPNIVSVLQVGQTDGGYPYLVMQYHRQGSLEARIRRLGLLPLDEVLRVGVKMAAALENAHRLGILHRDVKPANILLTDYGEPALCDFGIAHISGGFKTATGAFTGSPAFTAPEILSGDPPSQISDAYSLGATLFAALTGHAAFERRSGEQVVAQFLRIATESVPDLRQGGIPDDVSAVVEMAMARDPAHRLAAAALGEELQRVQSAHGFPVDDMAMRGGVQGDRQAARAPVRRVPGNLPLQLTSFVGRDAELAEVKNLLSTSRLVTLTGVGGVGKTRLALHAVIETLPEFADGVWLVELGELRDGSLLVDAVAASLGLRDEPGRPLRDVLVDFLRTRNVMVVLDNCEQVVDAAAKLTDTLLRACPELRILATSRERLGIAGESALPVSPLAVPGPESKSTKRGLPGSDAMMLFAQRAADALPRFELTENNEATVARICSRLDGLPLAIELAAARLRAISPEQLLELLTDRYAILTRGSRGAPTRQQTLSWSVGWSYDLCTPAEQQLWSRLSVFAGGFELEAAEYICRDDLTAGELLDLLSALVDKSILIRSESTGAVRFRLLDTLRDYGREQILQTDRYLQLRQRHADWFRLLASDAAADWFSPRQVYWLGRLEQETANLWEAMRFSLTDSPETALAIVGSLHPFGIARGILSETRRWLERALSATQPAPTIDRVSALYGVVMIAGLQGDLSAMAAAVTEALGLIRQMADPVAHGIVALADGFRSLVGGEFDRARARFEDAVGASEDPIVRMPAMMLVGWALEFGGDISRGLVWQEKALAIAEAAGETVFRSYALWSVGVGWWRHGKPDRAEQLLRECLRLTRVVNDPRNAAACMEALAWIARAKKDSRRAVVLLGAAGALGQAIGVFPAVLPDLVVFHDDCEHRAREALGAAAFEDARQEGGAMNFDQAVAYVLGDEGPGGPRG